MADSFLSRWSRRKQEIAQGVQSEAVPEAVRGQRSSGPDQVPAQAGEPNASSPAPQAPPAAPLPTLDDVKSLTPSSDFQPFMQQGVAANVRNAAVKKLFTDPHFNVMDGLDIYIGDYNTPDPLPAGMLQKMVGARLLNLFPEDSTEPVLANASPDLPSAPASNPDAPADAPVVAQSPPSPHISAQQAAEPTEHDHPDLQLQPNHAPASPSSGPSTG